MVLGGVGDYFDVSDHVIQMINYTPHDATEEAQRISKLSPVKRQAESHVTPYHIHERIPIAESISPLSELGKFRVYAKEVGRLNFGRQVH